MPTPPSPSTLAAARSKLQNIVAPPTRASSITGLNPPPQQEVVGSVVIANDPNIREMPPTGPTPVLLSTPSFFIPKESGSYTSARHEMIAIIGAPGAGKTTSCLTFPNRTWIDFDRKLPEPELPNSIPFWSSSFCDTIIKPQQGYSVSNRRDAFKKWLRDNHRSFVSGQTLILDSWTMLQDAFNEQTRAEDDMMTTKNSYWFWAQKLRYAEEIINLLKAVSCRVIVTLHETRERNEQDQLTGKIRPVMDGSFKDKLLGYFSDVFRQVKDPVKRDANGKKIMQGTTLALEYGYYWQVVGDENCDCNLNPTLGAKIRTRGLRIIPASYTELEKIYNS